MRSGAYKLSFVFPISGQTKRVLMDGVRMDDLAGKLAELGMEVFSGTPFATESPYDLIVAGGISTADDTAQSFLDALHLALADSGSIVFLLANRYGYSRMLRRARRGDAPIGFGPGAPAPQSLGRYLRAIRKHGFETTGVYAPIPGIENPSMIVPVGDSRPLCFLLSRFPDFSTRQPAFARRLASVAIRFGAHRRFMNWYIVVARKGRARD